MAKNNPTLEITLRAMKLIARFGSLPKLLRVRWTGQLTDGMFQSALASFVLFSPERQADALSAAVAFAVVFTLSTFILTGVVLVVADFVIVAGTVFLGVLFFVITMVATFLSG